MKTLRSSARSAFSVLAAVALALLVACSSMLTTETNAISAVTTAREVSTAMFRQGKITAEQDTATQQKLDAVRQSIVAAKNAGDAQALAKAKADADKITNDLGGKTP